jgi:multidrug efflux pump subunit AcrB
MANKRKIVKPRIACRGGCGSARPVTRVVVPSNMSEVPADSPVFLLTLTSNVLDKGQMYDAASTILAQKLSQISGVGQVLVGGSALPGVRIELNPTALNKYGIGLEQVRTVLNAANVNTPKGQFAYGERTSDIGANDQIRHPPTSFRSSIKCYRAESGPSSCRCRSVRQSRMTIVRLSSASAGT